MQAIKTSPVAVRPFVVSIIIPLYNKGSYIAETLQSLKAQLFQSWEAIVVDNGSTDNGPVTVRTYQQMDSRIRIVSIASRGPGAARNAGLSHAIGEWVLFLDADDLIEPDYLTSRLKAANSRAETTLVAGHWKEFTDGQTETPVVVRCPGWGLESSIILESAIGSAPWILHAALIRRSWLTDERRWPEALDRLPSEDAAFWFPVVCQSVIAWDDNSGAVYRLATPSSRNVLDAETRVKALTAIIAYNVRYLRSLGSEPTQAQFRTLVRVMESAYRQALVNGSRPAAEMALQHSRVWLDHTRGLCAPLLLRKILGLRLFNWLRFGCRSVAADNASEN